MHEIIPDSMLIELQGKDNLHYFINYGRSQESILQREIAARRHR